MSALSEAARDILAVPLFGDLMADLERQAIDMGVHAKRTDDATRQAAMAEVRAIRDLRGKIEQLAREDEPRAVRKAPA